MEISPHISYHEATKSATAIRNGISNKPNKEQLKNMILLAVNIFEPLREAMGGYPITISSFFRSMELNEFLRNKTSLQSKKSQHMALKGAAMDIDLDNHKKFKNCHAFDYIRFNLPFDQLIF